MQEKGPEQIPIATISVWRLVKDALLSETVKVREPLTKAEHVLQEMQDKDSVKSLQASEVSSSDCSKETDSEEEGLTQETKISKKKLRRCSLKYRPPSCNPDFWSQLSLLESSPPPAMVALPVVVEVPEPNNPGQVLRVHDPLQFKNIEQLKEASMGHGPHTPLLFPFLRPLEVLISCLRTSSNCAKRH